MEMTQLKIHLMQYGAVFTKNARSMMKRSRYGWISFADYATTSGIVLVLNGRVYANVPSRTKGTPFSIDYDGERFLLRAADRTLPVSIDILPVPRYALDVEKLEDGTPVRELVMTHADRVRISPVHGCSCHCSFCTSNNAFYRDNPIDQLDQAFQIALKDPYNRPRHVLISGGTPQKDEESYVWLNEVYRYFPTHYPEYEFDVMLSPRGLMPQKTGRQDDRDFLHYLKDTCGFDTMSINLELSNEGFRQLYIPDKAAIGRNRYLQFIEDAVIIFGENKIRSSLVVGLEPAEDTLEGVKDLVKCGCLPVLSAFVPAPGTDMANYPAPEVSFLSDLVKKADEIAKASGTVLGPLCRPCTHNSITIEEGIIDLELSDSR